jgi:hypothetical protein
LFRFCHIDPVNGIEALMTNVNTTEEEDKSVKSTEYGNIFLPNYALPEQSGSQYNTS